MSYDWRYIVPTRKRPNAVPRIESMFPGALWVMDAADAAVYPLPKEQILVHPDDVVGLPRKRQWMLDHIQDETLVMIDDDIDFLFIQCGLVGRRTYDPGVIAHVVDQAYTIAKELGTSFFGFSVMADVRKFRASDPFILKGWMDGVIGIIGRKYRFNTHLRSRGDIDFALKVLEGDRFLWCDNRFAFSHDRFGRPGGMTGTRTSDTDRKDISFLKAEWTPYLKFSMRQKGMTPSFTITRKQPILLDL